MKVMVLGSIALDTVQTPRGSVTNALGGSATYFACASQFFSPTYMVSAVGGDFPERHISFLRGKKIDTRGIQTYPQKTFRWSGYYGSNLNDAQTRETQLNVLTVFKPDIPLAYRSLSAVFLANFDPEQQLAVLKQMSSPRLIGCDTMNLWIQTKKKQLLKLLRAVNLVIVNDGEAKQLTGEHNLFRAAKVIRRLGPSHVVIKKGEHGCMLLTGHSFFIAPCYPVEEVHDPTGAGDSFAGGFFGYLASTNGRLTSANLKRAVIFGSVIASFTVESFSLQKLSRITRRDINHRFSFIQKLITFN